MLKKIPVGKPTKEDKKWMATEKHPDIHLPSFHVDDKQIPVIKNFQQGNKYRFIIDVRIKNKSSDENGVDATLEILAYKQIVKKKIEDMTDEEFGKEQGRQLSKSALKR